MPENDRAPSEEQIRKIKDYFLKKRGDEGYDYDLPERRKPNVSELYQVLEGLLESSNLDVSLVIRELKDDQLFKETATYMDTIFLAKSPESRGRLLTATRNIITASTPENRMLNPSGVDKALVQFGGAQEWAAKFDIKNTKDTTVVDGIKKDTAMTQLQILQHRLAVAQATPTGKTAQEIRKTELQIEQLNLAIKKAQKEWDAYDDPDAIRLRGLTQQIAIGEAETTVGQLAVGQSTREWLNQNLQPLLEASKNIDPNDPKSLEAFNQAEVALLQGLISQEAKGVTSVADFAKLLAPVQGIVSQMEQRRKEAERLEKQEEEKRKQEEEKRLEEEGLGATGASMASMFAAGASAPPPAAISAAPPPPEAAPVDAGVAAAPVAADAGVAAAPVVDQGTEDTGAIVDEMLSGFPIAEEEVPAGGGVPALGIQELLDEHNATGGGDPYHESEELDLDGSDNDAEEVIIEEISFMPPHPIRKFAPPVARGAPPVIINIGTGGFTPPII